MWRYFLGAAVAIGLAFLLVRAGGLALAMLAVPVFAWFASRILVHGSGHTWNFLRRRQLEPWHGCYYEFGAVHLRVEEFEGDLVFMEKDILAVLGQEDSKIPGLFGAAERVRLAEPDEPALTRAGIERLLLKNAHPEAKKLLLFLRREAYFPYDKKRGDAKVPA